MILRKRETEPGYDGYKKGKNSYAFGRGPDQTSIIVFFTAPARNSRIPRGNPDETPNAMITTNKYRSILLRLGFTSSKRQECPDVSDILQSFQHGNQV